MNEEIMDWKLHPITKEFFEAIRRNVEGLKEEVISGVIDSDPRTLAFKAGAITALRDVLDVDF